MENRNDGDHELSSFPAEAFARDNHNARPEFSLPRADGGMQAWTFLVAGFFAEAIVYSVRAKATTRSRLNHL